MSPSLTSGVIDLTGDARVDRGEVDHPPPKGEDARHEPPAARGRRAALRWRITATFALGGLVVSVLLAVSTHVIARSYLTSQREDSAIRQAYADASFIRDGLLTGGSSAGEVISNVSPRSGSRVLIQTHGMWYATELGERNDVPAELVAEVENGRPGLAWTTTAAGPAIAVGTPLPAVDARFYEVSSVEELDRTLAVLRTVLIIVGAATAVGAAVLGRYAARRVVRPLDEVTAAATAIASGRMDTRLSPTDDPDLVAIVASFNTMVDALAQRIEREARFTADVSHELRSPLTTLVTGVEVLNARRDDLPERSRQALDLVTRDLERFRRTLEDLLQLARLDAGQDSDAAARTETDLGELVRHVLCDSGHDPDRFLTDPAGGHAIDPTIGHAPARISAIVRVDRRQVERAVNNLIENADRHGGGLHAVTLATSESSAFVMVDDRGPGVSLEDRERVFARFARGAASRASKAGTGLGLSLVAETINRHDGAVWCTDRPGGPGARFVIRIPLIGTFADQSRGDAPEPQERHR